MRSKKVKGHSRNSGSKVGLVTEGKTDLKELQGLMQQLRMNMLETATEVLKKTGFFNFLMGKYQELSLGDVKALPDAVIQYDMIEYAATRMRQLSKEIAQPKAKKQAAIKEGTWRQLAIAQYFREKTGTTPLTPGEKRAKGKNFEQRYNEVTRPGHNKKKFRLADVKAAISLLKDNPLAQMAAKQYMDEL